MSELLPFFDSNVIQQAAIAIIVIAVILLFVSGIRFIIRSAWKIVRFSLMLLILAGGAYILLRSLQLI